MAKTSVFRQFELSKVVQFVKTNWGKIFLCAILLLVIFSNVQWGKQILGNDVYAPELDPAVSFQRSLLSPAWRDYRAFGVPSDTEQADIFRSFVFQILEIIFPSWMISQGYKFFALFCGPWFIALIARYIAKHYFKTKQLELVFVVAGLTYLFTLQTLSVYYFMTVLFVAAYGFFPMLLYYSIQIINEWRWKSFLGFVLSILLLSTAALTMTMFFVLLATYIFFFIVFVLQEKRDIKRLSKRFLSMLAIFLILTSFWLLPFGFYVANQSKDIQDSYINRVITPNIVENEAEKNTIINTAAFKFGWMDAQLNGETFSFAPHDYFDSPFVALSTLFPVVMLIVGTVYIVIKKKYILLLYVLLYFLGFILIAGRNTPFYFVLEWLQNNIPLFKQALRWQSSKLWPLMLIPLSLIAPFGVIATLNFVDNLKKDLPLLRSNLFNATLKLGTFILLISPFFVISYPFFKGQMILQRGYVEIPKEYASLKDHLASNRNARIYQAPEANTLYFRNHDWSFDGDFDINKGPGFFGSGFLNYYLQNKLIEKSLIIGSDENEQSFEIINNAYYSDNQELFARAIKRFNVDYVLSDFTNSSEFPGYGYNWELHKRQVTNNPFLESDWDDNFLALHKLKNTYKTNLEPIYSDHEDKKLNTLKLLSDNSDFTLKEIGNIYPLALRPDNIEREENFIVSKTKFKGPNTVYDLNLQDLDLRNLPTSIKSSGNTVELRPALPHILVNDKEVNSVRPTILQLPYNPAYLQVSENFVKLDAAHENINQVIGNHITEGYFYAYTNNSVNLNLMNRFEGRDISKCYADSIFSKMRYMGNQVVFDSSTDKYCSNISYDLSSESIIDFDVNLRSDDENQISICVWSDPVQRCINKQTTYLIKGASKLNIPVDEVAKAGNVTVFFDWGSVGGKASQFIIDKFDINVHSERNRYSFIYPPFDRSNKVTFNINKGDEIKVKIPIINSINSYNVIDDSPLYPPFDISKCNGIDKFAKISEINGSLQVDTKKCFVALSNQFYFYPQSYLNLIYFDTENYSGVPFDIKVAESSTARLSHNAYENRSSYNGHGKLLDYFYLPEMASRYYINIETIGAASKDLTSNKINNLVIMNVPDQWLYFKLSLNQNVSINSKFIPDQNSANILNVQNGEANQSVYINQSFSNGWLMLDLSSLTFNGTPIKVNGWAQGFVLPHKGNYVIIFWPNFLAYLGYLIMLVFVIVLLIVSFGRIKLKLKIFERKDSDSNIL